MRTRGLVNYTSIPPCKRTMIEIAIFPFSNTGLSLLITNTLAMSSIEYVEGLRKEPLPIGTSYSGVCHLCLSLSNEDNPMIFILISSTRKILWLPNYTNAGFHQKTIETKLEEELCQSDSLNRAPWPWKNWIWKKHFAWKIQLLGE